MKIGTLNSTFQAFHTWLLPTLMINFNEFIPKWRPLNPRSIRVVAEKNSVSFNILLVGVASQYGHCIMPFFTSCLVIKSYCHLCKLPTEKSQNLFRIRLKKWLKSPQRGGWNPFHTFFTLSSSSVIWQKAEINCVLQMSVGVFCFIATLKAFWHFFLCY